MKKLILICLLSISLFAAETVTIFAGSQSYTFVKKSDIIEENGCIKFTDFFNNVIKACGSYSIKDGNK